MKYPSFFAVLLGSLFLIATPVTQAAYFSGDDDTQTVSSEILDDAFIGGNTVTISAPITGDTFAAGNSVRVNNKIGRTLFAAGSTVDINTDLGHNLFAAAETVIIKGEIAHDVYVVGQNITIDPSTRIHGQLRVAGKNVVIAGTVDGNAFISSEMVATTAIYGKDVNLDAEIIFANGGSIAGNLIYKTSEEITDWNGLTVAGLTKYEKQAYTTYAEQRAKSVVYGLLSMLMTGAALLFFFRRKVADVVDSTRTNWAQSLGVGVVALIIVPVIAFALMLTIVGIPLALVLIATYFILLYVAGVMAHVVLGAGVLQLLKKNVTSLWIPFLIGLVIMAIVGVVPVLGGILGLAFFIGVFLPTLGSTLLWWYKNLVKRS